MNCKHCRKRKTCSQVCENIERELSRLGHSVKGSWRIQFFDPHMLEVIAHVQKITYSDLLHRGKRHDKYKKRLVVLVKRLTKRQQQCTIYYYGLTTGEPMTQKIIAKRLRLSQNTVAVTLKRAVANLKVEAKKKD